MRLRAPLSSKNLTYDEVLGRLHTLEESLRKCERLATAGRYAGAVIHEVNNPLEAIGNLVYLTRNGADDAPQVRKNMQVVESQLAVLGEITRRTLSFYREESVPAGFDLAKIAEAAVFLHLRGLPANRLILTKQFSERALIHGRAGEILQVLSNLILNALRALPDKSATLRLRIRIVGKRVHMVIADNGHGIPLCLRGSLFDPFVSGHGGGTGMGLWLSKQIMDRHFGAIHFRSSVCPGRSGTVFRLTFPLLQAN